MAVAFLLDEHVSPRVAEAAVRAGLDVVAVAGGELMGSDDEAVLRPAVAAGRIVVTYNSGDFARHRRSGAGPLGAVGADRVRGGEPGDGGLAGERVTAQP